MLYGENLCVSSGLDIKKQARSVRSAARSAAYGVANLPKMASSHLIFLAKYPRLEWFMV